MENNILNINNGAIAYATQGHTQALEQHGKGLANYPRSLRVLQSIDATGLGKSEDMQRLMQHADSVISLSSRLVAQVKASPSGASFTVLEEKLHQHLYLFRAVVKAIEHQQQAKQLLADENTQSKLNNMLHTFIVFTAFMFLFFMATYWLIHKTLRSRQQAAELLREKEQLFSILFYKSPIMLALTELSTGKIIDTNDNSLAFLGYSREQVIGRTAHELKLYPNPQDRENVIQMVLNNQKVRNLEMRLRTQSGEIRDVMYNIERMHLNNLDCILLAFEDITDRKRAEKKLKDSELLFSTIFYKSPIIKSISDANTGAYLDVNDRFCQFFGYPKEEILGKSSTELQLWKNEHDRTAFAQKLRNEQRVKSLELEVKTKQGAIHHISTHAEILRLDGKECIVSAAVDITEKKQADELIRNLNISLEKSVAERIKEVSDYKYALDQSSIVEITDKTGAFIYVNDNFCNISGYRQEELLGKNHRITKSGYHSKEFFQDMWETISRGNIWKGEIKDLTKDGVYYWTETTIVPILDEQGSPHQYLAIRWDITSKKASEEALLRAVDELRMSSERLKEAQALSHVGSWEFSLEPQEAIWSDEIYRILGTSPTETPTKLESFMTFVHPEDVEHSRKMLTAQTYKADTSYQFNCRMVLKNGSVKYLYNEFKAIVEPDGKPVKLIGITHDVTKEWLAQLENERITSDLLQRNKDLEQFAYIVSHNLRAPVANIMGLSNLIRMLPPENSAFKKSMDGLQISVNKLDTVIKDLNNVLQIRRQINEMKEEIDLQQLVDDIKSMVANLIDKENVLIYTDFSRLGKIYSIKSYLHSIFSNLISNSIKYRQPDQRPIIEIIADKIDSKIYFYFRDNGLGIDLKAHEHKLFGLYKRFHFHTDGKGMGLFMVKTQVETLGGKIYVQSEVNKGTEFILEFEEQHMRQW
ncbi:PAS domain-containing sensor histidine kinase [Rufibacter immobilis]|uniref:PAS domain-containing sensor histidine kinase n=1 Tax=Rufibacter immobilis TaxID=1348778 RepID=UPI00161BA2CB|nr:PAS domain-containing sensor histidine kinase [Rufibacter immobilis]